MISNLNCYLRLITLVMFFFCVLVPWTKADENELSCEVKILITITRPTCDISSDDQPIIVHFKTIGYKSILNGAEPEQDFTLHLINCDTSILKSVSFNFRGNEDPLTPGLLALDSSSLASGFAIGIRNDKGDSLLINKQSEPLPIQAGNNNFNFKAYLKSTQDSKGNSNINVGEFSAQAILELRYE